MLRKQVIKEIFKVIDKKCYAVFEDTDQKREVDPCEARVELCFENQSLLNKKQQIEIEIQKINEKLEYNSKIDGELTSLGYCRKDNPVYLRTPEGVLFKDKNGKPKIKGYTHQFNCPNHEVKK